METLELTGSSVGWQDKLARHIDAGDAVQVRIETPTLSPAQFADRLGLSRPAVMNWIARGKIKSQRAGTYHRIPLGEVERFRDWYFRAMATDLAQNL